MLVRHGIGCGKATLPRADGPFALALIRSSSIPTPRKHPRSLSLYPGTFAYGQNFYIQREGFSLVDRLGPLPNGPPTLDIPEDRNAASCFLTYVNAREQAGFPGHRNSIRECVFLFFIYLYKNWKPNFFEVFANSLFPFVSALSIISGRRQGAVSSGRRFR